jgi:uncharacterized membrane protein
MAILMLIMGAVCGILALFSFVLGAWYSPYPFVFGGLSLLMVWFAYLIQKSDKSL